MSQIVITDRSAITALSRLINGTPAAMKRGMYKVGLLAGRFIAERAPQLTRRLARSFLTPDVVGTTVILGRTAPIYAAIHEFGGDIVPKNAAYLTFQVGGQWVRTKKVHITEKRYARGGLEAAAPQVPLILGAEIAREFRG